MPLRLHLIQGPLGDDALASIAALYGPFNSKYADAGFCRTLFNGNPTGWSLHAFLSVDGGGTVGHYALLPFRMCGPEGPRLSGKGEAFAILEPWRADSLPGGDESGLPCGIAMAARLYQFGAENGLDPIHMFASADVGLIHRMAGARSVRLRRRRRTLGLRPAQLARREPTAIRRLAVFAFVGVQRTLSALLTAVLGRGRRARVRPFRELEAAERAGLVAQLPRSAGWSAAVDGPGLEWFAQVGGLLVVTLPDAGDFAIVCPRGDQDRIMEIMAWGSESGTLRGSARLLRAIVDLARHQGHHAVSVGSDVLAGQAGLARLERAAEALGYQRRERDMHLFVRTTDPRFHDPASWRFSPFFHAVF